MMKPISVFVGIAKSNTNRGMYSISIYCGGDVLSMPSKSVSSKGKISDKEIILEALKDALKDISSSANEPVTLDFYGNNDAIKTIWNKYSTTGKIEATGQEKRLWDEIVDVVIANNVTLTIKGQDSILRKLNQMETKKARSDIKRKENQCK